MGFDNICKRLAEFYPRDFAAWLLGEPVTEAEVLKTELSNEPVRADAVILLRLAGLVLHIEFQTTPYSQPPLPLRMLDYWVRLHRQHELPIAQFVIVLEETGTDIPTEFRAVNTWHRYNVLKLWEQDVAQLREMPGLLPLAPLMYSENPKRLLALVAERIMQVEPLQERRELVACAHVLAGLRFDAALVKTLFPEEVMQESVTYQDILQRGLLQGVQQGMQQGIQQGMQQGRQQGMQQGKAEMVLRLLTHRFGPLEAAVKARVAALEVAQLDQLSEALLDFQRESELLGWLEQHA